MCDRKLALMETQRPVHFVMFLLWLGQRAPDFIWFFNYFLNCWSAALFAPNNPSLAGKRAPSHTRFPASRRSQIPGLTSSLGLQGERRNNDNWLQFMAACILRITYLMYSLVASAWGGYFWATRARGRQRSVLQRLRDVQKWAARGLSGVAREGNLWFIIQLSTIMGTDFTTDFICEIEGIHRMLLVHYIHCEKILNFIILIIQKMY